MATPSAPLGFRQTLGVLRPGPFRRYVIGEGVSMTGTWMQVMAQGWVMTTLTQSAFMLGLVHFASGIPMLILSMVGGTVADRFEKRLILLWTQVVQIAMAILMGVLVLTHQLQLWHVLAVAVLLGVCHSFEMPAASALVPELVDKEEIAGAIAIDRSVFHATRLVGPAAAGILIAAWGAASAFFVNALTFVALMVALLTLPARAPQTAEQKEKSSGGMKQGLDYVRSDKPTLAMIALMATFTLLVFPTLGVMMPLYATEVLGLDARGMGILMAVSAVGSLTGSLGLLTVRREKRLTYIAGGVAAAVVALLGLALAQHIVTACLAVVLLTVGMSTMIGLANTTIQERAPHEIRGRVSAIAGLSFFGLTPVAGLLIPGIADLVGIRAVLAGASLCFALSASIAILASARSQSAAELPAPTA